MKTTAMNTHAPPLPSKRATLLVAIVVSFLAPYLGSAVNVALPDIQRDLSATAVQLSWIVTAYVLVNSMAALPMGRIADIRGRKLVLTGGIAFITVSSALCAAIDNVGLLIALRALQGLAGGAIGITGMAIVTSVFPPRERGKVFGMVIAAVYTGLSVGPFAGGILTRFFGWRGVFLSVPLLAQIRGNFTVKGTKTAVCGFRD